MLVRFLTRAQGATVGVALNALGMSLQSSGHYIEKHGNRDAAFRVLHEAWMGPDPDVINGYLAEHWKEHSAALRLRAAGRMSEREFTARCLVRGEDIAARGQADALIDRLNSVLVASPPPSARVHLMVMFLHLELARADNRKTLVGEIDVITAAMGPGLVTLSECLANGQHFAGYLSRNVPLLADRILIFNRLIADLITRCGMKSCCVL